MAAKRITFEQVMAQKTKRIITEAQLPTIAEYRKMTGSQTISEAKRNPLTDMAVINARHKQCALFSVTKRCKYCSKRYTYSLLLGDANHGACNRGRCILNAMRNMGW